MTLARVIGTVVATEKHPHYKGLKILVVQPIGPDGKAKGKSLLAVDGVQAGIGDRVIVVDEGGSARLVIGDEGAVTVRTAIAGIVDSVDTGVSGGGAHDPGGGARDPGAAAAGAGNPA